MEATVKRELTRLGYGDCPASNGRIAVEGDWTDVARLNVLLRTGERVLIELGNFPAHTFDELFDGVFSLPWEEYLTPHTKIVMDGKAHASALMAVKAAGGVSKKAILRRLGEKLRTRTFDEKGERAIVGISILSDRVCVTLDTSGDGLHKRGYRTLSYDAPLKETVAAAMVERAYFRAGKPFADLFCGSGTLPIEAAMYAQDLAPGISRNFDFTRFKCAPDVLPSAREEARDREKRQNILLHASDISEKAVQIARYHAKRAGVYENIEFSVGDMRDFTSAEKGGILLSNPPYGERLGKGDDLFSLYRDFSRVYRRLDGWDCHFLSGYPMAERAFGAKADRKKQVYNANLPCTLYSYLTKR